MRAPHHDAIAGKYILGSQHQPLWCCLKQEVTANNVLTYMTRYQVELVLWLLEHIAGLPQEVQIACSMKAILTDCTFLIQVIRQSVHVGMRRHALVKSSVKDCDLQPSGLSENFSRCCHHRRTDAGDSHRSSMLEN